MGCGCNRRRASQPLSAPTLRQINSGPTVTFVIVSSNGQEVETLTDLESARAAWAKYRAETDPGARLLQRTVSL